MSCRNKDDCLYAKVNLTNDLLMRITFTYKQSFLLLQKRHVRVAITFETLVNFSYRICKINARSVPEWPVYSDFTVTFPTLKNALCTASNLHILHRSFVRSPSRSPR